MQIKMNTDFGELKAGYIYFAKSLVGDRYTVDLGGYIVRVPKEFAFIYKGGSPSTTTPSEGVKHDQQKDPWQLMPWDAVRGIVKVLAFGAKKYEPRNWEKGMDWDRLFRATIEHMTSWWQGEEKDPETGYSHLWHAGCCILFLIAYEIRGIGTDNRPK